MPTVDATEGPILLAASDDAAWEVLQGAAKTLDEFGIAWRRTGDDGATPDARAVIVASPDAELPARWSEITGLPTIRVPVEGGGVAGLELLRARNGELPAGPAEGFFATMAIGPAGAKNAALFVVAALAGTDESLRERLARFRREQTTKVLAEPAPAITD